MIFSFIEEKDVLLLIPKSAAAPTEYCIIDLEIECIIIEMAMLQMTKLDEDRSPQLVSMPINRSFSIQSLLATFRMEENER